MEWSNWLGYKVDIDNKNIKFLTSDQENVYKQSKVPVDWRWPDPKNKGIVSDNGVTRAGEWQYNIRHKRIGFLYINMQIKTLKEQKEVFTGYNLYFKLQNIIHGTK